ncbi:hypothetical protein GCM10027592_49830 [Spirosoma flavus]
MKSGNYRLVVRFGQNYKQYVVKMAGCRRKISRNLLRYYIGQKNEFSPCKAALLEVSVVNYSCEIDYI